MSSKVSNFKIKVAIAEDSKYLAERLTEDLKNADGITTSGVYPNGKILLEEIAKNPPHVILMDVRMGGMDGIEATFEIKKINPEIKVIAWSVYCDVPTIIKMFRAGASAFLDKDANFKEIVNCIKKVWENGYYENQYFSKLLYESILRGDYKIEFKVGKILLTENEITLTKLLCTGWNNKQLTDEFNVDVRSIQRDVKALLEKTNTGCIALLVIFALENKIIFLKDFPPK